MICAYCSVDAVPFHIVDNVYLCSACAERLDLAKNSRDVYLDDVRDAPPGWRRTKGVEETIELLRQKLVDNLSLDHDLGQAAYLGDYEKEKTGYDVLLWLEQNPEYLPLSIIIHSMNPVGARRMKVVVDKLYREKENE